MKNLFYYLIYLNACGWLYCQPLTDGILEKEYENARQYFNENNIFETIARENLIEPAFGYAIVFPEWMRYNRLNDYFETSALEVFYVQYGKSYANFSIGKFQIKPVFAEVLDSLYYAMGYYTLNTLQFSEFAICNLQNFTCRTARLKRLKSTVCQWKYVILFCRIMDKLYKDERWENERQKLKFYATAYNCGVLTNRKKIIKFQELKYFHIGNIKSNYTYNYSDISLFFYNKFIKI